MDVHSIHDAFHSRPQLSQLTYSVHTPVDEILTSLYVYSLAAAHGQKKYSCHAGGYLWLTDYLHPELARANHAVGKHGHYHTH